tara:strand:- start:456 stop:1340 length:885 start_codon:yes stop_codon:yes gene_type:complete
MYLEISNVAAALGKNPYESKEKMLLVSWARHCPKIVFDYLIYNNCIIEIKESEISFTQMEKETVSESLPKEYDVKDFVKIENDIINEYKRKRNNEQSETEIEHLKEYTKDILKKTNGNNQEFNIIKNEKYKRGNDKMYYYNIMEDACIGGKNDAIKNDILIEIKTRTRQQNVRKNEYDLYQLICYLIATGINKGKIVQVYNKVKYDSDFETEQEYGIIDLTEDKWKNLSNNIILNLKNYFNELRELIKTSNYIYLSNVIPNKIRPICKYEIIDDKYIFCEDNVKFKNLLKFFSK